MGPEDITVVAGETRTDERPGMSDTVNLFDQSPLDTELNPILADKMRRNREFSDLAAAQNQQLEAQRPAPDEAEVDVNTRLTELEEQAEANRLEATKWRLKAARTEEKLKKHQKRLTELQQQPQVYPQQQYIDPRQLIGRGPEDVITGQDAANLFMSMASALGNQLQRNNETILEQLRSEKELPEVDPDIEATLVEAHPWLESLDEASRAKAMADLARTDTAPAAPQPKPRPITGPKVEQARARVREMGHIESSNRGSEAERRGQTPAVTGRQALIAEYNDAVKKPGGSTRALEILAKLGAGIQDEF
jgi:hypothetical protein